MEKKFSQVMGNMHAKQQEGNKKYEEVQGRLKIIQEERQSYKDLYEDSLGESKRVQERNEKLKQQNGKLKESIGNLQS